MSTVTATQPAEIAVITVNELNPCKIAGTLVDEDAAPVPKASLSSLVCTLYDQATNGIINSRDALTILDANGGTYHATSGAFALELGSSDNVIVTTTLAAGRTERHYALIEATWSGGGYWSGLVRIQVRQVHRAP